MKGIYSGNQDWLSRQRWIPIVLVVVTVVGGWVVGSKSKRKFADKDWEVQQGQQSKEAATGSTATGTDNSLGDAAKRMKHHKACLELKKDNPSMVCP
jgi:hypothetical protein